MSRSVYLPSKKAGIQKKLVGLLLQEKGVLRRHQVVYQENQMVGEITSGTYSPTLKKAIGFARVDASVQYQQTCWVDIRGKQSLATIVHPPFVRGAKK